MKKRVAIYVRVSTSEQTVSQQVKPLKEYCKARGFEDITIFKDKGISGAKVNRPQFDNMMGLVRKRKIDIVLVFRFDRFARTTSQLMLSLDEFIALGVDFISYSENVDTSTPAGRAMFGLISVFAQFEREMIAAATRERLHTLKDKGIILGRPGAKFDIHRAFRLRKKGYGWRKIAKELGSRVSYNTIRRVLQNVNTLDELQDIVRRRRTARKQRRKRKKAREKRG